MIQEFRYAVRALWRTKGVSAVAILCLGFGIGLNTTIFSIVDGVILKPYPYRDPDRIVVLGEQNLKKGDESGLSLPGMRDWKEAAAAFTTIAASLSRSVTIADGAGEPERLPGAAISWDLFPLLGVQPILGRGFRPEEDQPNAAGVVLLSHTVWTTRYQSDAGVVGRRVLVNSRPHTVVGVMPPKFNFPEIQEIWIPLTPTVPVEDRGGRNLFAFGRMAPGVGIEQALQELNGIAARLAREFPKTNEGWTVRIRTLREAFLPSDVNLVLGLMMAGVTLVLCIACSNVANLLLARAGARRREFAVRVAMGAGRGRIVRQLLTEGVVLALASVPLGLLLAQVGTKLIESSIPPGDVPYYITWEVDWRSLVYTIAIAFATALAFGLFPAVHVSRRNLQENLKEGDRGNTGGGSLLRSSLVVTQVSLALVALVGALLFVRSFLNLDNYDLGFETRPFLTLRYYMTGEAYEPVGAKGRRAEDIVRRVELLPGVEAAFSSNLVPIDGGGGGGEAEVEGRAIERQRPYVAFSGVTPHFLRALAAKPIRGRDFTETEGWSRTPVAIVNQAMASRGWPGVDPIERRFRLWTNAGAGEWFRVIGVIPDMRVFGIEPGSSEPMAAAFVPYAYQEALSTGLTIRVAGDPASIGPAVRRAIRAADENLPIAFMRTLEELRSEEFWQYAVYGWIFSTIGVVGLLMASVGVYGVLAYSVSQRTQEIGVRVALGADRLQVLKLVVSQGLRLAIFGVVIGLTLAAFGMPLTRSLLFGVSPFDPVTFAVVSLFLLAVAAIASYVPARRAAALDPLHALREG